jgi:hypothetical protein
LSEDLKGRMGVARTRTTVVLGSAKETSALPSLVIDAGA